MACSTSLRSVPPGPINSRPPLRLHGRTEPPLAVAVAMLAGFGLLVAGCLAGAVAGLVALLQRW